MLLFFITIDNEYKYKKNLIACMCYSCFCVFWKYFD